MNGMRALRVGLADLGARGERLALLAHGADATARTRVGGDTPLHLAAASGHAECCAEVEACKSVTKVIPNAPCFGISKEFLDKHQIHVVAMGQEYVDKWPDPADDKYYGVPRTMGIARVLPRTPGLSTSELIKRVKAATVDKKSET